MSSVRAELTKLSRSIYAYIFLTITAAGTGVLTWLATRTDLSPPYRADALHTLAVQLTNRASVCEVLASLFGIWIATKETADGTWCVSLLIATNRRRLVAAKLVVVAFGAFLLGLVAIVSEFLVSRAAIAAGSQPIDRAMNVGISARATVQRGPLIILVAVVLSLIWFAIGLYLRHPVGAIAGYVAYLSLIANGLVLVAPGIARWLPEGASQSIAVPIPMIAIGSGASRVSPLGQTLALCYLAAMAFAFTAIAFLGGLSRDFN